MTKDEAMKEVITLDFSRYWPLCRNKSMTVGAIIDAVRRWRMPLDRLPKDIQEKVRAAEKQK